MPSTRTAALSTKARNVLIDMRLLVASVDRALEGDIERWISPEDRAVMIDARDKIKALLKAHGG